MTPPSHPRYYPESVRANLRVRTPKSEPRHLAFEVLAAANEVLNGRIELAGHGVVLLRDLEHHARSVGDAVGFFELALEQVAHRARVFGDLLQSAGDPAPGRRLLFRRVFHLRGDVADAL